MSAVAKIKLTCQVKIASEEMKNVERVGEKSESAYELLRGEEV